MVVAASCCGDVFPSVRTGKLVRIEGMMDGAKYREIIEGNLFQSSRDCDWDGDSPSSRTMTLSILHTAYDLKIAVHQRNPSNLKELEQFCLEEWAKITVAMCAKLIEKYPKSLAAVIAAKGGSTKY